MRDSSLTAMTGLSGMAISAAPPSLSNLYAYWRLDEASGTRQDSHTGNHDLSSTNVLAGTGISGNAALFEGDDFLSLAAVPITSGNFTVAMFVKIVNTGDVQSVYAQTDAGASVSDLAIRFNDDNLYDFNNGGGALEVDPVTPLQWHHLAMRQSGTAFSMFLDGVLANSAAQAASYNGSVALMVLGLGLTNGIQGLIDDMVIFNRALTNDEINYLAGHPGTWYTS